LPSQYLANIFGMHRDLLILRRKAKKIIVGYTYNPTISADPLSIIWNIRSQRPLMAESRLSSDKLLSGCC
jgi:hypothetical protein